MDDLNDATAIQLFDRVWRRLRQEMAAVGDLVEPELRASQRRILVLMPKEGLRVSVLAERAQMTPQSLSQLVEVLRHGGYLEMVPDPADRRARLVRPTPKGVVAGQSIEQAVRGLEQRWSAEIGEDAWKQLRGHLEQLAAAAPATSETALFDLRGPARPVV